MSTDQRTPDATETERTPLIRRLFRTRTSRIVTTAVLAAITGFALLGGPGTIAYLSDQAEGPSATISAAAGLTATATAKVDTVTTGSSRFTVAAPGTGIVPGVRAQRISFVVTAGASNPTQTVVAGKISATATPLGVTMWGRGALLIGSEGTAGCVVSDARLVEGKLIADVSMSAGATLKAGESCTITVNVAVPATLADGTDVAREMRAQQKAPVASFALDATLTQVPRSEERP
ncbi:hypothetical protein D9V32_12635 [Mycetocola tolaasinivorans]|uniref:Uncharacterized protein n=1 Tax=Mycetocola tolaasinivorans TaxID=76635 RepID=A0A3L7A5D6_9MICO|nr:hypothetical protein [Mycetocola tolaasinivorans]RLP74532.1 hypothetical protein D9V32_12635 [Mycetocola tolaasinivorans]